MIVRTETDLVAPEAPDDLPLTDDDVDDSPLNDLLEEGTDDLADDVAPDAVEPALLEEESPADDALLEEPGDDMIEEEPADELLDLDVDCVAEPVVSA